MPYRPRIAMFGSSLVSAYWNGAATYYRGVLKYLERCGWDITFYEPDAFERQKHRDLPEDPPYARVVVYPADERHLEEALQNARGADIWIKASGVGIFDRELEQRVAQETGTTARIFWDVDAPATLERMDGDPQDAFRPLVSAYDMILTYGGGSPVVEAYRGFGARACVPIYNALDPDDHHPVEPDERFAADLAFLGNRLPDREARVMDFFFGAADRLPKRSFLLAGNGWHENVPTPDNVRVLGHVFTRDHNAFNATPHAVLNISRDSMARFGFSPATRVFEAAGAGACLITDLWPGLERFLVPGRECLAASSGEDVAAHLDQLTPQRAAAIGGAARKRLLAEHTYAHRARQLDALLRRILETSGRTSCRRSLSAS